MSTAAGLAPLDLAGWEPRELYPVLGSHRLASAIDQAKVALAVHGHAHHGSERGATPGRVPVRNVAQPLIDAPYRLFTPYQADTGWAVADTTPGSPGGDHAH